MPDAVETCSHCGAALRQVGSRRVCPNCLAEACLLPDSPDSSTEGGDSQVDLNWLKRFGVDEPNPAGPDSGRRLGPFGDYEVLEQIGRGGMGVIFKARQASLNRFVAVKMITSGTLASPEAKERFRTEAEAAARLEHPNIVPIYEVGEDQGQQFYAMRLIEGPTLAQELKRHGAMPPPRAARLLATLARAVHYAHQRGILHRDLKPANVLLDADGQPHITDFGLAKLLESDAGLTLSHAMLGTPNYMAPEQAAGGSKGATTAADVYSLGAMLYEMLTGRMLFGLDSTAEAIRRLMTEEPPALRTVKPDVPRDLETICLKCLQKEARRRYGSAEELAEDLDRWMREEPIRARRVRLGERVWLWCRRNPALAGLAAALVLTLTVGSAVALTRIAAAREQEQREQYFASISLADAYIRQGEIELAKELLFHKCPERFRQWEWGYLVRLCHQEMLTISASTNLANTWTPWEHHVKGLAFDRTGKKLGYLSADGVVRVFLVATGSLLFQSGELGRQGPQATVMAWGPAQDQLGVGYSDGRVRVWESERWQELQSLAPSEWGSASGVRQLAFSPDGELLAVGSGTNGVAVWGFNPRRTVSRIQTKGGLHPTMPFTADGRLVIGNVAIELYDAKEGRRLAELELPSTNAVLPLVDREGRTVATIDRDLTVRRWFEGGQSVALGVMKTEAFTLDQFHAFSPDGRLLYTGGDKATARVWDLATGSARFTIPSRAYQGVFSPDSRLLVTLGSDPIPRIWDLRTGEELLRLKGHVVLVEAVAFSPDNRLVASADRNGVLKIWRSDPGRELIEREYSMWAGAVSGASDMAALGSMDRTLELVNLRAGSVVRTIEPDWQAIVGTDFSPDGKLVATAGSDRCIHIWEVETGNRIQSLLGHTQAVNSVEFSPDRRWVVSGGTDRRVILWDARTGLEVHRWGPLERSVFRATFSPDGSLIAGSTLDLRVHVWDTASKELLHVTPLPLDELTEVQFTPDSRRMITAGGALRWWDARTGQLLREVATSEDLALMRLSPDGERLVLTGSEGWTVGNGQPKMELRDGLTGRLILNLVGHHEVPMFCRFSSNGLRIVSGAFDNTVRQWESFPWKEGAYPRTTRQLLEQRIREYSEQYWRVRSAGEHRSLLPLESPPPIVWRRDRSHWPVRDSKAGVEQIDLTQYYTGLLNQQFQLHGADWHMDNHLGGMPAGMVEFAGVKFDVRGVIVLRATVLPSAMWRFLWLRYPKEVADIEIRKRCRRLHFLQAATWWYTYAPRKGIGLGHYRIHYADGKTTDLPIVYGQDVGDWFVEFGRDDPRVDRAAIAWKGTNSWLELGRGEARVYLRTYDNPRPEAEISTIDFVSAGEQAAPMLIALTVE